MGIQSARKGVALGLLATAFVGTAAAQPTGHVIQQPVLTTPGDACYAPITQSWDSYACQPQVCAPVYALPAAPCDPGPVFHIFGEALFLHPTGGDVTHAQAQNGIGGAGTVPFGKIGVVDHDFATGFRVGGGIYLDACSEIAGSYAWFSSDGADTVTPPIIPGGGGAVGSLVHHPGAVITASAGPVTATQDTEFQLADIFYRSVFYRDCRTELKYLVGGQYGKLDQQFGQTGVFSGGQGGVINTTSNVDFDGGGVKLGLESEHQLAAGFSAYGRLTGAAMTGRFDARYAMQNATTNVALASANWSENRVVGNIEYELGLGWTSATGRWHTRAGYLFSHWTNVVSQDEFIGAVQANNYTGLNDTITFDGAVGRVEFRW